MRVEMAPSGKQTKGLFISKMEAHMNTRSWYRILFVLICLSLVLAPANGNVQAGPALQGETDFAAIDAYVAEQIKELGIPGMALGIVRDGQIAHLQSFGKADSSGQAVTPQTPFYLGSVSKSFTALAVMQLVEAGQIDLDAPVQAYLPWFELADKEASAQITVRNLLNQTSGISTRDGNRFWASRQGLEETVRGFSAIPLAQPVGEIYQYSNINFGTAGLIVEKVSGQPYADYVSEYILEPLDMRHSYASRGPAQADGLAHGHRYVFGRVYEAEWPVLPVYVPSGFLMASAEDMTHYAIAQLNDGQYGDASVLSPQGIAELHAPAAPTNEGDSHYAMGWNVGTWNGIPLVQHNGDDGRNHATVILMPDRDSGIILLANASGFEQILQVDEVAKGVLTMLNGEAPAPVVLPFQLRFLYWAILLAPLTQILGIVFVWRRRKGIKGWGVLLTVVLNLAVVLFLFALAQNIPFPLRSLLAFYPEVGYGLIVVATLGIGWSVLYTVTNLRQAK